MFQSGPLFVLVCKLVYVFDKTCSTYVPKLTPPFNFQLNCKYLGNRIEKEIADALTQTPQLVKLGVTMEFRDSLNRTAVQLQKNLDKRKYGIQ